MSQNMWFIIRQGVGPGDQAIGVPVVALFD